MTLDFEQFVGMRLNEHVLHTWDIEVVDNPTATLLAASSSTGRRQPPTDRPLHRHTHWRDPHDHDHHDRTRPRFHIDLSPDAVNFTQHRRSRPPTWVLPAEAFTRLVYGRLDPEHTPADIEAPDVALLRRVFPGP